MNRRPEGFGKPQIVPSPKPIPDLSFVIPAFNEAGNIARTVAQVDAHARRLVSSFEIIIVDDGSFDSTFKESRALCAQYPLRVLRLSRNFGKEQAIMAGLERTVGAAVVILDADLQEPLSHLETMLEHRAEGYEMVYAVRAQRRDETWRKRLFTRAFYALLNIGSDTAIPANARDFRLMDRRVVDALCALPERNRFMKGLYGWVGFRTKAVAIELAPRATGASKFGFAGLFKLGLTGLTSFTAWPLRVWTGIGMTIATCSILYALWIAVRTLIFGIDVPGWSTLVVAVMLLGGVQLISIGVLGEYLSRVFTEVKGRPGFIIAEDFSANSEHL
ncbi:glycosyl transferase family 2 [Sulfitobacter sp. HI0082]|jgi:glycosyltransferase involved in cell wall biosynthesis|uniref:glycosyltransferase family 2 protein n=1 Tax=unclassified Sulfitobacter TaxID=196795 RepID=UPI0007C25843|nr:MULTISPECIES: glycosyltransferase family 2 protein [unclassified Sulfitobacter]KZX98032.1 glycosyl transferase family 2 [Sulfitobacter sp. HI0021]KZY03966.1 glycosyl transferase family 2 [Sulfitobacter sp. HI0027]KZZ02287.1 glycosyl transferase family 2 [Sulfitobacter sp. HI0076]KZZ24353.1 glycosyl transferase family 2 [Sulfitobacter sp. HI0082]|tara:strand:+ start:475 stop:1470 length:996 start_codon:yes stop_codon:yes gene_type:complete